MGKVLLAPLLTIYKERKETKLIQNQIITPIINYFTLPQAITSFVICAFVIVIAYAFVKIFCKVYKKWLKFLKIS